MCDYRRMEHDTLNDVYIGICTMVPVAVVVGIFWPQYAALCGVTAGVGAMAVSWFSRWVETRWR